MKLKTKLSLDRKFDLFCMYSVLFALCFYFAFLTFRLQGKTFMVDDGVRQHSTALAYWGKYLRKFLMDLFSGNPHMLQWDMSLGLGADVIQTLHYYVIGEPLNYLAVFFSPEKTEALYCALIVLRMFLAGLSFIIYCRVKKIEGYASLCGGLAYAFCGYALYCGARHPFFIPPMIYFPVICLGLDYIFERRNPFVFVAGIWLLAITTFYFLYTHTIMIFVYAIIHFFFLKKEDVNIKNFAVLFVKTTVLYLLALALSAPILLPNIAGFTDSARVDNLIRMQAFYEPLYYVKMVLGIVSPATFGTYSVLGFAAPVLIACVFIFLKKDCITMQLRIILAVCVFFLAIPYMGHVINGFNYVTNRWCSAVAFPACFAMSYVLPCFYKADSSSKKQKLIVGSLTGFFAFAVFAASFVNGDLREQDRIPYLIVLVMLASVSFCFIKKRSAKYVFLPVTVLSVIASGYVRFSPKYCNYIEKFNNKGCFAKDFSDSLDSQIKLLQDGSVFRVDCGYKFNANLSAIFGTNSTNHYWAQVSSPLVNFYTDMNLCTGDSMHLQGFNERRVLQNLFSVKYCIIPEKQYEQYSLGLNKIYNVNINGIDYVVAENENALPLVWTFDKYISYDEISKLNVIEKQAALVQAAVISYGLGVSGDVRSNLQEVSFDRSFVRDVPCSINYDSEVISLQDNVLSAKKNEAAFNVVFEPVPEFENYLCFEDVFYENLKYCTFSLFMGDNASCGFAVNNKDYNVHSTVLNGGSLDKEKETCTVVINEKGKYNVGSINVRALDLAKVEEACHVLKKAGLTGKPGFSVSDNKVTVALDSDRSKLVCFSIPYARGWKAYVNGTETDVLLAQDVFCGVLVPAGHSEVVLVYRTPWLRAGFIIMLVSLLAVTVLVYKDKIYPKKH